MVFLWRLSLFSFSISLLKIEGLARTGFMQWRLHDRSWWCHFLFGMQASSERDWEEYEAVRGRYALVGANVRESGADLLAPLSISLRFFLGVTISSFCRGFPIFLFRPFGGGTVLGGVRGRYKGIGALVGCERLS